MAQVTISNDVNLAVVAQLAGSTGERSRQYRDGIFYVDDVSQEVLEAAVAQYQTQVAAIELDFAQQAAIDTINTHAEQARLRYLTGGVGQSLVYQEKADQAVDFIAAGAPSDLSNYPFIQAEVDATGASAIDAANSILAKKALWISIGSSIEFHRLSGKRDVMLAGSVAEVQSVVDVAIAQLALI